MMPLDTLVPDGDAPLMSMRNQNMVDWASVEPSFTGTLSLRAEASDGGDPLPHLEGNQDYVGAVLAAHYGFDAARVTAMERATAGRRLVEANPCPCLYHLTFEALGSPLASPGSLADRLVAALGPLGVAVLGAEATLTRVSARVANVPEAEPTVAVNQEDSQAPWALLLAGAVSGCACLTGVLVAALVWRRRAAARFASLKDVEAEGRVVEDMDMKKSADIESVESTSTCAPSDEVSSEGGSVTCAVSEGGSERPLAETHVNIHFN